MAGALPAITPEAVTVGILINYNPHNTRRPWTYVLGFPMDSQFQRFLTRAGFLSDGALDYTGGGESFHTPQGAEECAEIVAKSVIRQYKKYLEAEKQARKYTLIIPLNEPETGDNNE